MSPSDRHGCLDCASVSTSRDEDEEDEEEIPLPCRSCVRTRNGDADHWTPVRECRTCFHASRRVDTPPCAGCALNADEAHRGEALHWTWREAADPAVFRAEGVAPAETEDAAEEGFFDPVTGEVFAPGSPAGETGTDEAAPCPETDSKEEH